MATRREKNWIIFFSKFSVQKKNALISHYCKVLFSSNIFILKRRKKKTEMKWNDYTLVWIDSMLISGVLIAIVVLLSTCSHYFFLEYFSRSASSSSLVERNKLKPKLFGCVIANSNSLVFALFMFNKFFFFF